MLDGMCPPESFSSLDEQVRLRRRDDAVRAFWASGKADINVAVVFGKNDPLLRDYWHVLKRTIRTPKGEPKGVWIKGAGALSCGGEARGGGGVICNGLTGRHENNIPVFEEVR